MDRPEAEIEHALDQQTAALFAWVETWIVPFLVGMWAGAVLVLIASVVST